MLILKILNFEQISEIMLVLPLLNFSGAFTADFEQVNANCVASSISYSWLNLDTFC